MEFGKTIMSALTALCFYFTPVEGLPANKAHAQEPKAPNYAAQIEQQNKSQVGAAEEALTEHRGRYLAGKRPKIKDSRSSDNFGKPGKARHNPKPNRPAAKPDMASGSNHGYTAVESMDQLVDLMEQSEEFQAQWDLIERNTEKFNKASVDQLLGIPGQYKLVLKDGKLDLDNSYALVFYKEGISTFKRPSKRLKVKIDGKLMDYKQDGHMGDYYFVPEFKDLINLLEIVTGSPISENDALKLYQSSRRKGEQICSVGDMKFLYNSNSGSYDMVDDRFESLTLAEIVCKCDARDCKGVDHLAPGSQVIVDKNGNVVYRHILLDPADDNHPVQVFDPVTGEMMPVYRAIAMVPLRQLLGDTGVYNGERKGDDQDAARTAKIEREPDTQDVNRKIDLGEKEDEVGGVEPGDDKQDEGQLTGVDTGKAEQRSSTDTYLGASGLVSTTDLVPDDIAGGFRVYAGKRLSNTNWSLGLDFGYLYGGSRSDRDTDRTAANPNDLRNSGIVSVNTIEVSNDYHILAPRVTASYDATENLKLTFGVGADVVIRNTDTSIEERLEYPNKDLASDVNRYNSSDEDVKAMPAAAFTLDYKLHDKVSVNATVSGATDGDNYNITGGAGVTFHWDW